MVQKQAGLKRLACVAALGIGAAGCTMAPYQYPAPQPSSPGASAPPSAQRETTPQNSASVALLEASRADRDAGRYDEAAASLERALRIDPNNALLWVELAEIRAADGDRRQAQEMARKALSLAGSDRAVAERARRLL